MNQPRWRHALIVSLTVLSAGLLVAQFPDGGRGGREPELLPNAPYDGKFTFVRIRYDAQASRGRRGVGDAMWNHDYPRAEYHFDKILAEVSYTATYLGGGNVLRTDDPELFNFPIAYLTEPGFWAPSEAEVDGLRRYLTQGGFLIVDDFANDHWFNFEAQMRRVLPEARPVQLDVNHPIFDSFFGIESLELTHPYYGVPAYFFGIFEDNDPAKRLIAIINYNNDIAEYWEWSDEEFAPIELTNEAYKLGVNYIIYAMTH